ncbi:MAG: YifB family Mg chelatase-like AAA ATPase [Candidatus Saccharibacteria bacterium]|nr:YifB family Mg chelatase-like AAA ATPase [Candidatus Saccharibacteria bacterium]
MTISKTYSAIPIGTTANLVTVECDSTKGLPTLNIVGMANKTIEESRERIRAAIRNSGFYYPTKDKITINLAPAELQKTGSFLDVAIAVAILTHFQQFQPQKATNTLFVGELALDGKIRPIRGILNILECATKHGFKQVIIPAENAAQATLFRRRKVQIIPASTLAELWQICAGLQAPNSLPENVVKNTETGSNCPFLDQIIGQTQAKRALTVAVAGHHNILLFGPPGAGKSALASTIPGLLPAPTNDEIFELTKLHSLVSDITQPCISRPFRAPHHSSSLASLIGKADGLPGEITLAHLGVLFLDELPEFRRDALEALRQPLENKQIALPTTRNKIRYPADFMLVATMNPCPCGHYGSDKQICSCAPSALANYRRKLSGPLLDRIDMQIKIASQDTSVLVKNTTFNTHEHETAKTTIQAAMNKQFNRAKTFNSSLSSVDTVKYCALKPSSQKLLDAATKRFELSARSYFKILKIARTIADLDNCDNISDAHLNEALQYRQRF